MELLNENEIIRIAAECGKMELSNEIEKKRHRFSGRAQNSLKVDKFRVVGVRYISKLFHGVNPGTVLKDTEDFRKWCLSKFPDRAPKSSVFAIIKKTKEQGSAIYRGDTEWKALDKSDIQDLTILNFEAPFKELYKNKIAQFQNLVK